MKTICLGPEGSFSEDALIEICARLGLEGNERILVDENRDILPSFCATDTVLAVSAMHTIADGRVEVPFTGLVDLFDSSLEIGVIMALKMPINFSLLAQHGAEMGRVKGVIAHQKAFGPCSGIIASFPQFKAVSSNSEAARMVAVDPEYSEWVALASPRCGRIYDLSVLAQNVSDKRAMTTFYAFSKNVVLPQPRSLEWRVLTVFDLLNIPGALFHLLGPLQQFNLSHINSRHISEGNERFVMEIEMVGRDDAFRCAEAIRSHTLKALTFAFPVLSV